MPLHFEIIWALELSAISLREDNKYYVLTNGKTITPYSCIWRRETDKLSGLFLTPMTCQKHGILTPASLLDSDASVGGTGAGLSRAAAGGSACGSGFAASSGEDSDAASAAPVAGASATGTLATAARTTE